MGAGGQQPPKIAVKGLIFMLRRGETGRSYHG